VEEIGARFADILAGPVEQRAEALKAEGDAFVGLPRLVLPFNRRDFARLRQLIDFVNRS
jgi:hypothetical protein